MAQPIRFLHLSDFHIGKDEHGQSDFCDKIVAHVADEKAKGNVPDLIFLTGDIANKGQKKEYEKFRSQFYTPLMNALGADWPGRFFSVPGNHDVARPPADGLDPEALCAPHSRLFDPTREGKTHRDPQVIPRFKQFKQLMPCAASSDWVAKEQGAFAETVDLHGTKIGIVGINTAWLSRDDKDREKLTPGLRLVEAALNQVKPCAVRIVLGHHPLHWLRPDQQQPIRTLFGEYGVIYLHGHLHRADGRREDGGGRDFLALQSGAAFQVRPEDSLHKNGLLWGELDLAATMPQLNVSPRYYNPDNRDWPPDTDRIPQNRLLPRRADWWAFPVPDAGRTSIAAQWQAPAGWQRLDKAALDAQRRELTSAEAERYFDGAEPEWATVLSNKLPHRAVVGRLSERIAGNGQTERPLLALLTGPGGEGKSTALRQIVVALAGRGWQILWRQDADAGLTENALSVLPQWDAPWLIATDAADMQARQLHQAATRIAQSGRQDVHFLFCARASDWNVSGANLDWSRFACETETLSGLDAADAKLIAQSWRDFDATTSADVDSLARQLEQAAKEEATLGEGALLGGVLVMRRGAAGLRAHVHGLLARLAQTRLTSGKTLRDALAYIAVMHAEGLDFLSRPVLAEALGCIGVGELNRLVLQPLGREAAAGGGTFVRTRHRRIAKEVMAIEESEGGGAAEEYLLDLVRAAKLAFRKGGYVPALSRWEYDLPNHLLTEQNFEAAINIGRMLHELDSSNVKLVVSLASIYRNAKDARQAEQVLRHFTGVPDRDYWCEWATCASETGDQALAAWLAGWSLAGQQGLALPHNKDAMLSLVRLGFAFGALHADYNDPIFNDARLVVARWGLRIRSDARAQSRFEKYLHEAQEAGGRPADDPAEMFSCMQAALQRAWECCGEREILAERLPRPEHMRFEGLRQLLVQDKS